MTSQFANEIAAYMERADQSAQAAQQLAATGWFAVIGLLAALPVYTQIVAGRAHTCALTSAGGVQ